MATITQRSGGVKLLGFEIRVPDRGGFFLELGSGLTVLYGKNGIGKSTILRALANFSRGIEGPSWHGSDPTATALYQVDLEFIESTTEQFASNAYYPPIEVDGHGLPPHGSRSLLYPQPKGMQYWKQNFGTLGRPDTETLLTRALADVKEVLGDEEFADLASTEADLPIGPEGETMRLSLLAAYAMSAFDAVQDESVAPDDELLPGWPSWYLAYLRAAAALQLAEPQGDRNYGGLLPLGTPEELAELAELLGVNPPSMSWSAPAAGRVGLYRWKDLATLLLLRLMQGYRAELVDLRASTSEKDVLLAETLGRALKEFIDSRLIRVVPSGAADAPSWSYELCARSDPETGAAYSLLHENTIAEAQGEPRPERSDAVMTLGEAFAQAHEMKPMIDSQLQEAHSALVELRKVSAESGDEATVAEIDSHLIGTAVRAEPVDAGLPDDEAVSPLNEDLPADEKPNADFPDWTSNEIRSELCPAVALLPGVVVSGAVFRGTALPFDLCDLRESFDIGAYVANAFASALWVGDLSFTNVVASPGGKFAAVETELVSDGIRRLCEHFDFVGRELRKIDIGVSGLRLVVSQDVREWLAEKSYRFEAQDAPSQRWVPVEALSSAQQTWLGHLLRIHDHLKGRYPLLVIVDEPEAGVHASAAKSALDYLASLPVTTIAASHAPASLRLPEANLQLVDRDFWGRVVLGKVRTGDDVRSDAVRLGTTPMDLLGAKSLLVYVEGSHDEAVVQELLKRSADHRLSDRILVVPARGVRNIGGVAGAVLLTDFTDLHVLAVVDNARSDRLDQVRIDLDEALREGQSVERTMKRVRSSGPLSGLDKTTEERVLGDLLERSAQRGMLHRVHLFGLSVPDIIDTLPPRAFGVDRPWEDLRAEHAGEMASLPRYTKKPDFKTWLRERHQAKISTASIRDAVTSLSSLPEELARLLSAIESASEVARVSKGDCVSS